MHDGNLFSLIIPEYIHRFVQVPESDIIPVNADLSGLSAETERSRTITGTFLLMLPQKRGVHLERSWISVKINS